MKNELTTIIKEFEGAGVEIIEFNGEILFELYSTGMALGQVKFNSTGKAYPRKERIDENIKNAEINCCVLCGHNYLNEDMLYDFMLEAKTDKCKAFRKWVTTEVLPAIRKHGAYIGNGDIDEPYLNNGIRFSKKRTINTFANCNINEIKQLVDDFLEYAETLDTKTRIVRCNSAIKGLERLHDKLAKESVTNIGDCYNLLRLQDGIKNISHMAENRRNGGIKSNQTVKIKALKEELNKTATSTTAAVNIAGVQ